MSGKRRSFGPHRMVATCSQAAIPETTATSRPKMNTLLMIQRWLRPTVEAEVSLIR